MSTAVEASLDSITNEPEANKLFRMVMKYKGSDLHLKVGFPPSHAAGRRLAADAAPAAEHRRHGAADVSRCSHRGSKAILDEEGGVDFAHIVFDGDLETRFRVNLFKQRGRLSLVARRVNNIDPQLRGPAPAASPRPRSPSTIKGSSSWRV